jgi:hypothetical protein
MAHVACVVITVLVEAGIVSGVVIDETIVVVALAIEARRGAGAWIYIAIMSITIRVKAGIMLAGGRGNEATDK